MSITIYGIKNCDTMKKAMQWLEKQSIDFEFHDYKKQGINQTKVKQWLKSLPLEELINRRGTTWRKLPDDIKDSVTKTNAPALIAENTSLVKRPLLDVNGTLYLGFKPDHYKDIFSND